MPGDAGGQPLVAIIVLNWNGWRDTLACLASLQKLVYPAYRVLVVDNGSTDGSEERIRAAYPHVALLQTGANLGYAGGNNAGMRRAAALGADYVVLVNPDVCLEPDTLSALVDVAEADSRVAALSPVIYDKDRPDRVWFAGATVDWAAGRTAHERDVPSRTPPFRASAWASGCCLLLRTAALAPVGLLDERYFLYFEEADLCQRMQVAGYRVGVCTAARAFHRPSTSTGFGSPRYLYYNTRNALLFFTRHGSRHHASRRRLIWTLLRRAMLSRGAVRALLRRDPNTRACVRGCLDYAAGRFGRSPRYG